jgi:hypothetical protein
MAETGLCVSLDCDRAAAATLEGCSLCLEHFLMACYEQFDRFLGWQQEPYDPARAESVRRVLDESTRQASEFLEASRGLTNLERARLIDILARAKELARHLRRSERKPVAISVVLRSDTPGRAWEETTETQLVSLHGAKLQLQHQVRNRETLVVIRRDTLQEARAQVAWRRNAENGRLEVGIEFLNVRNFWQMEWSQTEPALSRSLH